METLKITKELAKAAEMIKEGALVAVPTETVYGLACNGLDSKAVERIYEVKGRPPVKPLSLMVSGAEDIARYCEDIPPIAYSLAEKYWPGPLTIVLKAKDAVPEIVRAGGSSVGLRCPDHALTQKLLKLSDLPFAAPSANPSGKESPKSAAKVLEYFDGQIEAVIDGGECGIGKESTLIDLSALPYKVLREAAVPAAELEAFITEAMSIIGITGGSACGKTSALNALKACGAMIIDCDALYHEMLRSDGQLKAEIFARFPGCESGGELDRKALGAVVFNDSAALADLNRITHRHIDMQVRRLLKAHAMDGGSMAAIDAVELINSGIGKLCDAVIGISADREVRVERIMRRDNISREAAQMRLNAQKDEQYYIDNCDYMLMNNGSVTEFIDNFMRTIQEVVNNG